MASPQIEVFFLFNANTGAPLTGATPTFSTYKDSSGGNVAQPTITELGGGAYKFTPVFADPTKGIFYVITATNAQGYVTRFMRPEDWYTDNLAVMKQYMEGRWKVFTSGPDANRLVFYDVDGVTILKKFDLKDAAGAGVNAFPYERVPL